jgi:hypothetical protein
MKKILCLEIESNETWTAAETANAINDCLGRLHVVAEDVVTIMQPADSYYTWVFYRADAHEGGG